MRLSSTDVVRLAAEVRLACMRISRRVRFESPGPIAPHQFSVMARLREAPRTPRELADIERVSAPSMTRTTNGLVDKGWVRRVPDPTDGRQVILSLTPDGIRALDAARRARDEWMTARVRSLSPTDQETLAEAVAILERLAQE